MPGWRKNWSGYARSFSPPWTIPSWPTRSQNELVLARQRLTEEMQRLLADYKPAPDEYMVGGIPVDSEYIIFIIDTSGSMQQYAWDRVQQQIRETLEVYPQVRGIQVFNDMGDYMFRSYRNEWIPDTPSRRESILAALRNWRVFSNSSPREGILEAIGTFYDPTKNISLYVYSDDFASGSIDAVVREVDRRNQGRRRRQPPDAHSRGGVPGPLLRIERPTGNLRPVRDSDARTVPAKRRHLRGLAHVARLSCPAAMAAMHRIFPDCGPVSSPVSGLDRSFHRRSLPGRAWLRIAA